MNFEANNFLSYVQPYCQVTAPNYMDKKSTENKAEKILLKKEGYVKLSNKEKSNLALAFMKKGFPVHKKAFDLVRTRSKINFLDEDDITRKIKDITLIEMKSTARSDVDAHFSKYFFGLTMREHILAQSLKNQYIFVFVHTKTENILELNLSQLFSRIKNYNLVAHITI